MYLLIDFFRISLTGPRPRHPVARSASPLTCRRHPVCNAISPPDPQPSPLPPFATRVLAELNNDAPLLIRQEAPDV